MRRARSFKQTSTCFVRLSAWPCSDSCASKLSHGKALPAPRPLPLDELGQPRKGNPLDAQSAAAAALPAGSPGRRARRGRSAQRRAPQLQPARSRAARQLAGQLSQGRSGRGPALGASPPPPQRSGCLELAAPAARQPPARRRGCECGSRPLGLPAAARLAGGSARSGCLAPPPGAAAGGGAAREARAAWLCLVWLWR